LLLHGNHLVLVRVVVAVPVLLPGEEDVQESELGGRQSAVETASGGGGSESRYHEQYE